MLLVLERWALRVTGLLVLVLVVGFAIFDWRAITGNTLQWPVFPKRDLWTILTVLGGTLIVVQGFETSRYLGSEFDRELRVWSCRSSQIISTIIASRCGPASAGGRSSPPVTRGRGVLFLAKGDPGTSMPIESSGGAPWST